MIQGIDYLHSNKLVHRDLKPTNILIDHDFIPYISDFDAIRHPKEKEDVSLDPMSYMSPEQFKGKNVSYPIDIYSFGLIFYYLYEKDDIPVLNGASSIIQNIFSKCLEFDFQESFNYYLLTEAQIH